MSKRLLENRMYKDPLTGMPNFLKFVEGDFASMFCEHGVVLIFDMVNFISVNEKYGRNIGDIYLKSLSEAITKVLGSYNNALAFRTGGDEYTIIFPQYSYSDIEPTASEIKAVYKEIMNEYGFQEHEVHVLMLSYNEKIESIEYFFEQLIKNSADDENNKDRKFCKERLFKNIINNITCRIKETMTYYNDAYSLALTDDVSGLPNHRAGNLHLTSLLEEYKTDKQGFAVLFIDGDNLKRYNKINYEAGNEMIRKLSQLISSSLRAGDKIYRWLSGDEFLVVIEESCSPNISRLAERIRKVVEKETKDWRFPITVSIGAACYPEDGCCIEQVIDKAEKANSMAKELGKNRIIKWNSTIHENSI